MDFKQLLDIINKTDLLKAMPQLDGCLTLDHLTLTNDDPLIPEPEISDLPLI